MKRALFVRAVAICAAGLADWPAAAPVLQGIRPYHGHDLPILTLLHLPATERRRITPSVRLALHVAASALEQAGLAENSPLRAVFACSRGNAEALQAVLTEIDEPAPMDSPRQFSRVDHNAAAGYWAIIRGPAGVSVSVGAYDGTFAAGLIEAFAASLDDALILLVVINVPLPAALHRSRTVTVPFAAAMLPGTEPHARCLGRWRCHIVARRHEDRCSNQALENLRISNPAARCLPLLQQLARGESGTVALPYLADRSLMVKHWPC
ncbi:MAG: beta-ketoacyl synthase chain length factor [Rhodospirillales bacterium]|nr:beta-ketoacyl synthase chain length factor [Rhodospirillales bacterium]